MLGEYIYIYIRSKNINIVFCICVFQADSILWQSGRLLPDVVLHFNRVRGACSQSAQNRFHLEEEGKVEDAERERERECHRAIDSE